MESILDRVGVETDGPNWKNFGDIQNLLLHFEHALHFSVDGQFAWIMLNELMEVAIHVILPEEVINTKVEDVLLHNSLQLCRE